MHNFEPEKGHVSMGIEITFVPEKGLVRGRSKVMYIVSEKDRLHI